MFGFIGCRTTKARNARGEGITTVKLDEATGRLDYVSELKGLVNPSYLTLNSKGTRLYAVHGDESEVSAFRVDRTTGELSVINTQSTQGLNPVHLALSPDEQALVVSNHLTSSLAVLPVGLDGALEAVTQLLELSGELGPHRVEQTCAKPHFNPFDPSGTAVIVPDKGLNQIFSVPFKNGQLLPEQMCSVTTKETAGPRNIAFHPSLPFAYVSNELDSTLGVFRFDQASLALQPIQVISSVADTFVQNSRASAVDVHPSGKWVYVSNRGENSVAVFEISPKTGRATLIQTCLSEGQTPRFFCISPSGRWLFVLNENSDSIIRFTVNPETGLLHEATPVLKTGSPVCMLLS